MRSKFLPAAIFAVILSFASEAAAHSVEDAIRDAVAGFVLAFNRGDAAGVASHYDEDAALLPPDAARVDGRVGIARFWKGAIDGGLNDLTVRPSKVDSRGNIAYDVGTFSFQVRGADGQGATASGKYVAIWTRGKDGHWRIHRDIWNMNPAPAKN